MNIIGMILRIVDSIIVAAAGWKHIPNSTSNFMYLNPYKYRGTKITLKDGTTIKKGDWVAEFHLDNKGLRKMDTSYTSLIRLFKGELKALQACFAYEPYSGIAAVYGITVFHEIAARQRFTVIEISNPVKRFLCSLWENILRLCLRKSSSKTRHPFVTSKECWISREQILS